MYHLMIDEFLFLKYNKIIKFRKDRNNATL